MTDSAAGLVEHFFRHESGRLVAVLSRVFGLRNADLVEDMVQSALVEAFQVWGRHGTPENPAGWVHRVARNKVLDALRQQKVAERLAPEWASRQPADVAPAIDELFLDSGIEDSQLRLIFACCHPLLSRENQIALTLKSLCGFSNREIGHALLISEETTKKRIQRARQQLLDDDVQLEVPAAQELTKRLDAVHECLYLLFNEGYATSAGPAAVRSDLCEEAIRLGQLLTIQPTTRAPATYALVALMLYHAARLDARTDAAGRILLLEEQDRSQWDQRMISMAHRCLDLSAQGRRITTYHLEAGISRLHCMATDLASTDWTTIMQYYDALLQLHPSPIYRLNRAIVIAHLKGNLAGIQEVMSLQNEPALNGYHLVDATLGELWFREGNMPQAQIHLESALAQAHSEADRELLQRKVKRCLAAMTAPNT